MRKKYSRLFFDLDRTLWDFEENSKETLTEVFHTFELGEYFQSPQDFLKTYYKHNERLWAKYRDGNIKKESLRSKRFELTLEEKKVKNPALARQIGDSYLNSVVNKTRLFPGTLETIQYLHKNYPLHILTNGFREIQLKKLNNCGLTKYFTRIFTSETLGVNKPHREIFHWAVTTVNAKKNECLMIGDDQFVDIAGAKAYGIDTVLFNPCKHKIEVEASFEIQELAELTGLL